MRVYDSNLAFESTTALGDTFARAELIDLSEDDADEPRQRGAFQ